MAAITFGAIGVGYGDIGTSTIYAFREALKATGACNPAEAEVLGILSLLIWTLILVVKIRYVFVLLRADNRGEGSFFAIHAGGAGGRKAVFAGPASCAGGRSAFCW